MEPFLALMDYPTRPYDPSLPPRTYVEVFGPHSDGPAPRPPARKVPFEDVLLAMEEPEDDWCPACGARPGVPHLSDCPVIDQPEGGPYGEEEDA